MKTKANKIKRSGRVYRIYHNMKSRCYLETASNYKYYGARGIKICKKWLGKSGFDNFYKWAIKNGYADELEIDRINSDLGYSPKNCRWTSRKAQNNNTRKNHYVVFKGERKTVAQWAEIFNIHRCVLNNRLRRGWNFEIAISVKTRNIKRRK